MFYCEKCRIKKNWPESISKSYGRCEICKKTEECNDVPSKRLPKPANRKEIEIRTV